MSTNNHGVFDVVEPITQEVSWEELTTPGTKAIALEKFGGKTITVRTSIPLDKLIELQGKYTMGVRKDYMAYFKAILRYIIVRPAIPEDSAAAERVLSKIDSGVGLRLVGDAVNAEVADEIKNGMSSPT